MDSDHVLRLVQIHQDRTAERRVMALKYREAQNPIEIVEKITAIQNQIDALERAIVHERSLTDIP